MALFQRGYDYDHHPSTGGYRGRIGGYRGAVGGFRGADWGRGYDRGFAGVSRYDRGYGDFGEPYRSRAQTDAGDPFGDRQSRTPIRVIRGDRQHGYDRPYGSSRRARGYDAGGGWFW
ncbi:MAG TPA: hypothetical protein VGR27_15115 [Longimicrobiaceae bacterium]|nr:hypothetical protein [Longimicrobiaceae bacterium]